MSSLTTDLLRGAAGLTVQSKGLEVAGNNLNNVNTAGYSRQIVQIGSGAMLQGTQGPEAMEVSVSAVTQARSSFLDQQVTFEKSLTGSMSALNDIYQQVQSALGQNVDTSGQSSSISTDSTISGGITGAMSSFFNAFQSLAANPADSTTKSTVISQAQTLALQINTADQNLAQVQSSTNSQISTDVSSVNGLLKDISNLNLQISKFEAGSPGSALDLRDQRQQDLEQLAGYMNFTTANGTGGNLQINVQDASGNPVNLVNGKDLGAPVTFNGTAFQAGSPTATLGLTSGSLPSELSASTTYTQSVRDDLSKLASQLITSVNAAYNPGGTGTNFFAAGTGAAGSLINVSSGISASSLTAGSVGGAGANDIATAVASVASNTFSTSNGDQIDGTLSGFFTQTVGRVGNAASSAASNLQDQQLTEQLAESQRDQVSGVSMDEETTNLLKYQRAFQASARYVNTIDQMLNTVINTMGV